MKNSLVKGKYPMKKLPEGLFMIINIPDSTKDKMLKCADNVVNIEDIKLFKKCIISKVENKNIVIDFDEIKFKKLLR